MVHSTESSRRGCLHGNPRVCPACDHILLGLAQREETGHCNSQTTSQFWNESQECHLLENWSLFSGAMAPGLRFRLLVVLLITITMDAAPPASCDYSSGASVHILNAGLDPILVHCESKDSDLGAYPVTPGANYSWSFSPNIFGMTLYTCEFFWKTFTQKFQAWKGSYYDTRPPCSVTGPCNYKVTPDGFYVGLQSYNNESPDNNGSNIVANQQLWAFYQPWLPLNASQLFPHGRERSSEDHGP